MSFVETTYGMLGGLHPLWTAGIGLVVFLLLGFLGAPLSVWTGAVALLLYGKGAPTWAWIAFAVLAAILNLRPLRRPLLTRPLMAGLGAAGLLPSISETERIALEAGTVWVDGELFSGRPDFGSLLAEAVPELSERERAFLDGPVEEVCAMTDDWRVFRERGLPEEVWTYLAEHRFFGLIVPEEHDGLGFSALAHSAVVARLASRSLPLAITVMVPNSLGPAELLIHYGTDEQKRTWLPRLARGEEMPCFALTEPRAGSDASRIAAEGIVFRGDDGQPMLRLNWEKRYITLSAVSTVIGLAFKLRDPEGILGKGREPGITCALVPSDADGVEIGERHDPLGVPFINGPIVGRDVVVPVASVIGGVDGVGQGWRMLMETLAAGRGISLPALSTAGVQAVARITGAYAAVRKQFGLPIGRFEGVEEPLARIGGTAWLLEAARRYTCGGLDRGAKPAVVTAIAKYHATELGRSAVNDGMDVLGGAGICLGPRNTLAHGYVAQPISITVEGANILTRTMMIFGQGAIRCHPYAFREITALEEGDLDAFDRTFWAHVGHVVRNGCRAVLLGLSRGRLARSPVGGPAAPYVRKLAWVSARFAFLADLAMGSLGGALKRKEKLAGRFSDVLSWMYLGTAAIRRFEAEGRREEDLPFLLWSMETALHRIQLAFDGLLRDFDAPLVGWWFRGPGAVWSRLNPIGRPPSDRLGHRIARALQTPGELRDRISDGIYLPDDESEALGRLESAFRLAVDAEPILKRIRDASREEVLADDHPELLVDEAEGAGVITGEEAELVRRAEAARAEVVRVDAFPLADYLAVADREDVAERGRRPASGSSSGLGMER